MKKLTKLEKEILELKHEIFELDKKILEVDMSSPFKSGVRYRLNTLHAVKRRKQSMLYTRITKRDTQTK